MITTSNEALATLDFIMERRPIFDSDKAGRRYQEYRHRMASHDLKDVAKVYCDLMHRRERVALSATERRLLKDASQTLAGAIATALNKTAASVEAVLTTCAVGGVQVSYAVKNALSL